MTLVAAFLLAILPASPSDAMDLTGMNTVSVEVLDWYSNMNYINNTHNITFRISFDTNNDGIYEEVQTSGIFVNATSLVEPFEAHTYVYNTTPTIRIVVEVLERGLITRILNGSGPVHSVTNEVNATGFWVYNNISSPNPTEDSYYILYSFQIKEPVIGPNQTDVHRSYWYGNSTVDVPLLIAGGFWVVASAIITTVAIVMWRSRRRSPPSA